MGGKQTLSTHEPCGQNRHGNARAERRGLECRACGCRHFEVLYTRPRPGGIMRVRQCRHCGKRLVTRETSR
jgi:hypothetical protein